MTRREGKCRVRDTSKLKVGRHNATASADQETLTYTWDRSSLYCISYAGVGY